MSQNDKDIIAIARRKDIHDGGWEQLQNRCESEEARSMVKQIEFCKWRREESAMDML